MPGARKEVNNGHYHRFQAWRLHSGNSHEPPACPRSGQRGGLCRGHSCRPQAWPGCKGSRQRAHAFYSYDEFVTAMGWDAEHFSDYTLQELVYSHFALYRGAPIIAVNVFDPARHRSEVSGESLTFKTTMLEDGTARLAHPGISSLVLSSPASGVSLASVGNGEADVDLGGLEDGSETLVYTEGEDYRGHPIIKMGKF